MQKFQKFNKKGKTQKFAQLGEISTGNVSAAITLFHLCPALVHCQLKHTALMTKPQCTTEGSPEHHFHLKV